MVAHGSLGLLQSSSWTLYETVGSEPSGITSRDWSGYPVLRLPAVPDSGEVHVIDRPGLPFLGTGEAAKAPPPPTRWPAPRMPRSHAKVKAAIGV